MTTVDQIAYGNALGANVAISTIIIQIFYRNLWDGRGARPEEAAPGGQF
jgi:hypothetical protein